MYETPTSRRRACNFLSNDNDWQVDIEAIVLVIPAALLNEPRLTYMHWLMASGV